MNHKKAAFISKQIESGEYYYLNLTPESGAPETVVCGGKEQCAPDYLIERNGFKFHSIEFVFAGKGTLTLRGKTWPLRPGALFFYGPGIAHSIRTDPEAPMLKHFVDFCGKVPVRMVRATPLEQTPLYTSDPLRIRSLFESLLSTGGRESPHRDRLCALLLQQLILTVDETSLPQQEAFSPAWQTYLRCRRHIEQNFEQLGRIDETARECHIDPAYLARLFKRYATETPQQLLTRLKIERAAEMLRTGERLIKQVAEQAGFPDPYHFSRVFKRLYGVPPETFVHTARRTAE